MANCGYDVYSLIQRLVRKIGDDPERRKAFERIMWRSIPRVYPDYMREAKRWRAENSKIAQRRKRIHRYIRGMASKFDDLYLVSLTFGECYDTTTRDTRDKYAARWLNAETLDYYACLDIGKKGGREHYHAICAIGHELEPYKVGPRTFYRFKDAAHEWEHGFFTIRKIESDKSPEKACRYAFKASTYAFKSADNDDAVKPWHKRGVDHTREMTLEEWEEKCGALPF